MVNGLDPLLTLDIDQFNRPKALNSFGGKMVVEAIDALRDLDDHPDTTFTIITGEGRFFCAGADVSGTFRAASRSQ